MLTPGAGAEEQVAVGEYPHWPGAPGIRSIPAEDCRRGEDRGRRDYGCGYSSVGEARTDRRVVVVSTGRRLATLSQLRLDLPERKDVLMGRRSHRLRPDRQPFGNPGRILAQRLTPGLIVPDPAQSFASACTRVRGENAPDAVADKSLGVRSQIPAANALVLEWKVLAEQTERQAKVREVLDQRR